MNDATTSNKPNFCDQCGKSLVGLSGTAHVARPCATCGKTIYVAEPGKRGKGIKVQKGDKFIIPAGMIKMSLDPACGSKLSRHGVMWMIRSLIFPAMANAKEKGSITDVLTDCESGLDELLENSPKLTGCDFDSEEGALAIAEKLKKEPETQEWFAYVGAASARQAREAVNAGDAETAAWATFWATSARAVVAMQDDSVHETLWRGYQANLIIHEAGEAAARSPAINEAMATLAPLFDSLDESVLHTLVEDGQPIGLRLGVTEIPEATLRARAQWQIDEIKRRRKAVSAQKEEKRKNLQILFTGIGVGGSVATAIVGIFKGMGWL